MAMDKKDVEIQDLRTTLNKLKKVLKRIDYNIEHVEPEMYDDGEAYHKLLYEIQEEIRDLNLK